MTRDEVAAVIREAIFNSITITYDRATDTDQISCDPEKSAEEVLAALAAAGLVIGNPTRLVDEVVKGQGGNFPELADLLVDRCGLALVRGVSE